MSEHLFINKICNAGRSVAGKPSEYHNKLQRDAVYSLNREVKMSFKQKYEGGEGEGKEEYEYIQAWDSNILVAGHGCLFDQQAQGDGGGGGTCQCAMEMKELG